MEGFRTDVDEIMACRTRLAEIRERAADILTLAEDANPEWYVWGLVGAPFAAWYWKYADDTYEHLTMMGEALQDRVEALDCTAQSYQQADQEIAQALQSIRDLLG
ncbi:hypothetical protein Ais01nite_82380 [Asanoa ishikariensis]|uniref:Excreted virulence factor EspC, type VII ESX diderm n=1 Tax=Asanoa ishikariensis TaxID=137265 RepID=A0A1H3SCP6_9ACTN|nr:hypothetical protein [Asanoa ishikariensis]GIF70203.1 hypothetical protein Ais01nite_82380 [Asanoa ishikariensis]SDZ35321.1 hypothetical protein SAMN05421684_4800 [Asanoa ishikariensis]